MLKPEAQAAIDQRRQEMLERFDGSRPLYDSAYTATGDYSLVEPGCEAWAYTADTVPPGTNPTNILMWPDGNPRGGIILEVTQDPDTETGELHRAFRCWDYGAPMLWQAVVVLTEEVTDPNAFRSPQWNLIRRQWRRICHEVGVAHGKNLVASREEVDLVHVADQLATIYRRVNPL